MGLFQNQVLALIKKNYIQNIRSNIFIKELYPAIGLLILGMFSDSTQFFWDITHSLSCFYLVVYLVNFVYTVIDEKGQRVVETYKIMGMKGSAYEISWFIIQYSKGLIIFCFFIGLNLLQNHYMFNDQGWYTALALQFFYLVAMINQAFLFTVFFSNAKFGMAIYSLLFIGSSFAYLGSSSKESMYYLNLSLSLLPQFAVTVGDLQRKAVYGDKNQYVDQQWGVEDEYLRVDSYLHYLIIDSFIYLFLYLYLKEVVPNEYGTSKSLFFLCKCKNKNIKKVQQSEIDDKESYKQKLDFSSAIYHEEFDNKDNLKMTVSISNLQKDFSGFKAVDGLSLCLYEKQILCLLGHNGSGKTTTISLLTGLLPKTKGQVEICGQNIDFDLDSVRGQIGLCGQKDVLFENLTIEEHLEFMCIIKGIPKQNQQQQIDHVIRKCALLGEKGKYSENLSGGNKRKLSLAISLVGDSRIILLDEPSSGLDPNSRRVIWDILKEVRGENRTLLLTTHHLEEAEELASRVAIMAKGKLLTVGQTDFIKQKFGIGFHLEVIMDDQDQHLKQIEKNADINLSNDQVILQDKNDQVFNKNPHQQEKQMEIVVDQEKVKQITDIVGKHIKGYKIDNQTQPNVLKFILPFLSRKYFQDLFKELETIQNISLNLEMNSLEEAFVNIGMDEDKLLKKVNEQNQNQGQDAAKTILLSQNKQEEPEFSNFTNIKVPDVLSKPPSYSFVQQVKAIFMRKAYTSLKTPSVAIGFVIPIIGLIAVLCIFSFTTELKEAESEVNYKYLKLQDNQVYYEDYLNLDCFDQSCFIQQDKYGNQYNQQEFQNLATTGKIKFKDGKTRINYDTMITLYSLILPVIYAFPVAFLAFPLIQEKEEKLKYALNVMGCKLHTYWIGTFLFDYLFMLVLMVILIILGLSLPLMDSISKPILEWIIVFIFFNFAVVNFAYYLSLGYEKVSRAQKFLLWKVMLGYFFVIYLMDIPLSIDQNKTKYYFSSIFFQLISPLFGLQKASLFIVQRLYVDELRNEDYIKFGYKFYDGKDSISQDEGALRELFYFLLLFFVQGMFFGYLTLKNDYKQANLKESNKINTIDEELLDQEPEVEQEQTRLEDPNCADLVKVNRLSKQYPNGYTAIKNNNFGVKEGEIFGLLGPNGAGKSTTFNVITSLIPKSAGSVKLQNQEVKSKIMDVYKNVGICPQTDPIWDSLTVYQHLKLFGMMKGLSGQDLQDSINYFIEVMQLTIYRNKKAGQLSGGNKRKLCVTMALIGGPNMQFFDEPSSGLDPIAKRFLWNSLNQNLKLRKSAITLTTHSMLEAESLSHKIGILINGRMQCIGSPDFLKKKYGEGYIISIKVSQNQDDYLKNLIQKEFPLAKLQVGNDNEVSGVGISKDKIQNHVYKLPYEGFSFFKTFKFFDEQLNQSVIKDFSVCQSSLEQVFLQFTRMQNHNQAKN